VSDALIVVGKSIHQLTSSTFEQPLFQLNLGLPVPAVVVFLHLLWRRSFRDKWNRFLHADLSVTQPVV